jgi:hypothetical protein
VFGSAQCMSSGPCSPTGHPQRCMCCRLQGSLVFSSIPCLPSMTQHSITMLPCKICSSILGTARAARDGKSLYM